MTHAILVEFLTLSTGAGQDSLHQEFLETRAHWQYQYHRVMESQSPVF